MTTASPLTKDQAAKALGIDLGKLDWTKILAVIQAILAIFTQQKQMALASGCPEHEAMMHSAIEHNLAATCLCLECCCNQPQMAGTKPKP